MADVKGNFLIYGATGYTGELIARRAAAGGMRPVLSGRNASSVAKLANELGLPYIAASVNDSASLDRAIDTTHSEHRLVLNCAGPFGRTADQVSDACMRKSVHYLDITGEINVFEMLARKGTRAKHIGVMLLPGVGFDVVPSDCLATYVARRVPAATRLVIAIHAGSRISRGTALTSIENMGLGGAVRQDGKIFRIPGAWKDRLIEFDKGPIRVTTMPWGDVATAYHSTGIPNIEVYMAIPTGCGDCFGMDASRCRCSRRNRPGCFSHRELRAARPARLQNSAIGDAAGSGPRRRRNRATASRRSSLDRKAMSSQCEPRWNAFSEP